MSYSPGILKQLLLLILIAVPLDGQEIPRLFARVTERSAVELSWEPVKTQAYRIERAVDPGGRWTEIARLSSDIVRHVDVSPPVPQAIYRLIVVWPEREFTGEPVTVMTGSLFVPKTINTAGIVLTGLRFTPVTINTTGIVMTGRRFPPVTITTQPIVMTGTRGEP